MSTTADSAYSREPQRLIMALGSFRVLPMNYMAPHWRATRRGITSRKLIQTMSGGVGGKAGAYQIVVFTEQVPRQIAA